MSLTFKKVARDNLSKVKVYIKDSTPTSPNYFRVSDVPQVLTKGKNLLRISAHPDNLMENTPILIDVRDSNGNPIYFEIPDYLEEDKSRVISIWIYHDKEDDNTANGIATVTLIGTSKYGTNGESIPTSFAGKSNVKWQTQINVDRNRKNTSTVIFNSTSLPTFIVSESIESYENVVYSGTQVNTTIETITADYIYKGTTPVIKLTAGNFNDEMVGARLQIAPVNNPPTPIVSNGNPLNVAYSSSIKSLIDTTTAIMETPFTTGFKDFKDELHTYNNMKSATGQIYYTATGSNSSTENKRSFANITLNSLDPIAGVVDKIKVLIKSSGLPGEYELLNEITVPFSSSVNVKVPIPSENLHDPNRLKIQYLNASGDISRTETISEPYVFAGGNAYIAGGENIISGSMFVSNKIGTGIEIAGISSGYIRSVGFGGQTQIVAGTSPGGFIIYSGSGDLVIGDDTLEGVGMQMIGENDDRHFIFSTDAGGNLDIKTDKFFVGTVGQQFISGSDGNIEISSSNFHLQNTGTIIAKDGYIGGMQLLSDELRSTSNLAITPSAGPTFSLKSNGDISGSDALFRTIINIPGVTNNGGGGNEVHSVIDTSIGLIDGRNVGRQLISDSATHSRTNIDDNPGATTEVASYIFHLMPFENTLSVAGIFTGFSNSASHRVSGSLTLAFDRMSVSSSIEYSGSSISNTAVTTGWVEFNSDISSGSFNLTSTGINSGEFVKTSIRHSANSIYYSIPSIAQASMCRLRLKIGCTMAGSSTVDRGVRVDAFSVIATRQLAAATVGTSIVQPITDNWASVSIPWNPANGGSA